MKDWKTTIPGVIGALFTFVLFSEQAGLIDWPRWLEALSAFAAVGGFAALGINAAQTPKRNTK